MAVDDGLRYGSFRKSFKIDVRKIFVRIGGCQLEFEHVLTRFKVVLLIYFTCSAYNKRKRRKYVARKERIREQDDVMLRNENFVRLNFRPMQLQSISQEMDPTGSALGSTGSHAIAPSAPQEELPTPNHVSNNRH